MSDKKSPFAFLKTPVLSGLAFVFTVVTVSVGYAAWTALDRNAAATGQTVTSSLMQAVIDDVNDLNSRVSNFSFSGGNVGIGTASPTSKLQIEGNNLYATMVSAWSTDNNVIQALQSRGTVTTKSRSLNGDTLLDIRGRGYDGSSYLSSPSAEIIMRASEDVSSSTNGGAVIHFLTSSNGTNTPMSRMIISDNGNVGIGTTAPSAKLEVNGDFIRTIARAQGYGSADGTDQWAIATRTLTFVKKHSDTGIRVTYSDGRRVMGSGNGGRWEAKFNGNSCASPGPVAWDIYMGIAAGADHHRVDTTVGTCFGLPAGTYTIQIYVGPVSGYPVADFYTGWNGIWSLEAEEVR